MKMKLSRLTTKPSVKELTYVLLMEVCHWSLVVGHWSQGTRAGGRPDKEQGTNDVSAVCSRFPVVLRLFLPLLALVFLSACDESRVYEENVDFTDKKWVVDTVPSFEFEIADPSKPYNIYWNVRNTVSYPYRNLYLTYYIEDTTGRRITTDLHNMLLFEPKTGKPYGSGLGDIFSHQFMALPDYKFDRAGVYRVRLEQYMRTDTLPEIVSVGMRVEDAAVGS